METVPDTIEHPTPEGTEVPVVVTPEEPVKKTPEELAEEIRLEAKATEAIEIKPTPKKEKKIFKAGLIDANALLEAEARDMANNRLTESKKDRSRNVVFRTVKRIWKHNLFEDYYRQIEIHNAKKEILTSGKNGNLYTKHDGVIDSTAHDNAMKAIVERFTSEYDEDMLKEEERESKTPKGKKEKEATIQTNKKLKELIDNFAEDKMSDDAFNEERNRILCEVDPKYAKKQKLYADNLFTIATQIREAYRNNEINSELDYEVDLTLGKARESLRTEAKLNTFDRIMQKTGLVANEATGAAAAAYGIASWFGARAIRSKAAQWFTFGGSTVAAAGISGLKESRRVKEERAQHIREKAKGMVFDEPEMKRREEMEKNRHETKDATSILSALEKNSVVPVTPETEAQKEARETALFNALIDLESRVKLGDKRKTDLVSYSRFDTVETERMQLDLARAKIKASLRKEHGEEAFNKILADGVTKHIESLEKGVDEKDAIFNKMKNKKIAGAMVKTAVVGATFGFVAQEAMALIPDSVSDFIHIPHQPQGIFSGIARYVNEHWRGVKAPAAEKTTTALAGGMRMLTGETPRMPAGHMTEEVLGATKTHLHLPEGVTLHNNHNGTYDILRSGETDPVVKSIKIEFDPRTGDLLKGTGGHLATKELLAQHGIFTDYKQVGGVTTTTETAADFIKHHPGETTRVHREVWFNNNTKISDGNETKLEYGGLMHGVGKDAVPSGLDKDGNIVMYVGHMTADGSMHKDIATGHTFSTDAPKDIKKGSMILAFSLTKDTQHEVFNVKVIPDEHGMVTIPKTSTIAKEMYEIKDSRAHFIGQYLEADKVMKVNKDGSLNVRMLATALGRGVHTIEHTVDTTVPHVSINMPDSWDYEVPFFMPTPRTPLERGKDAAVKKAKKEEMEDKTAPTPPAAPDAVIPPVVPPVTPPTPTVPEGAPVAPEVEDTIVLEDATPAIVPASETEPQQESDLVDFEELPPDEVPEEEASTTAPESKEVLPPLSQEEYNTLRKDMDFINKKIQSAEGIITVQESDLKSNYARSRYNELRALPTEKGVIFNRSELRTLGDGLENILSKSKIEKKKEYPSDGLLEKMYKEGIPAKEHDKLRADMDTINQWTQSGRNIFEVNENQLGSEYAKMRLSELKKEDRRRPALYRGELGVVGDGLEEILSKGKVIPAFLE